MSLLSLFPRLRLCNPQRVFWGNALLGIFLPFPAGLSQQDLHYGGHCHNRLLSFNNDKDIFGSGAVKFAEMDILGAAPLKNAIANHKMAVVAGEHGLQMPGGITAVDLLAIDAHIDINAVVSNHCRIHIFIPHISIFAGATAHPRLSFETSIGDFNTNFNLRLRQNNCGDFMQKKEACDSDCLNIYRLLFAH